MHQELLLLAQLAPLLRVSIREGTWVAERGDALHAQVPDTRYVHLRSESQVGAAEVAVQRDGPVAFALGRTDLLAGCQVFETVGEEVGVGVAEDEGAELHNADEAREVEDLGVGVAAVHNAREVEELCALVDLGPEALLEGFLGCTEGSSLLDEVEVSEDANDLRKPVRLEDIEKLKGFLRRVSEQSLYDDLQRRTISNPYEPSIMSRTRSATLAISIIELRSLLHSINVMRFFLPLTTVMGP